MKISQLFLGFTDGEEESLKDDFVNLYHEKTEVILNALDPKIYLILGRRGTGKTVLSHFLSETKSSPTQFIERVSFGDLTVSSLTPPEVNISDDKYFYLFQWILLTEFCEVVLKDESIKRLIAYEKLKNVFEKKLLYNKSSRSTFIYKLLKTGVALNITGTPLEVDINPFSNSSLNSETLPIFIDEIKELMATLLDLSQKHGNNYIIIIDDIDNHISITDSGINILKGLANALHSVNSFIRRNNKKSKITLMLRSDMFRRIVTSLTNKLREDHSYMLTWGDADTWEDSELFELLFSKIKKANPDLMRNNSTEMRKMFFERNIQIKYKWNLSSIETGRYLLQRTFLKPRDIIQYLNIVKRKFPLLDRFTGFAIIQSEFEYSVWLKNEVKTEMIIHFDDEYINNLFEIASKLNIYKFDISMLRKSYNKKGEKPPIQLEEALKVLYEFGVFNVSWVDFDEQRHVSSYYTDIEPVSSSPRFFDNYFEMHYGLQKSLLQGHIR